LVKGFYKTYVADSMKGELLGAVKELLELFFKVDLKEAKERIFRMPAMNYLKVMREDT
jgi:hypothetical protein